MTWNDEPKEEIEHELSLSSANESDSPDLLRRLVRELKDAAPGLIGMGRKWLSAKAVQEIGKAAEIRAKIVTQAAELEMQRQRLLDERHRLEQESRRQGNAHRLEERKEANRHAEKIQELKIQAFREAVTALEKLHAMGVTVTIEHVSTYLQVPVGGKFYGGGEFTGPIQQINGPTDE